MSTQNTFLKILEEKKGDLQAIKKIIIDNKDLINTEFEINNNSQKIIYSPLTYCIDKQLSELSIFLIEQGANINYKTFPNEDYPLLLACKYGLEDIVKKLLLYDNLETNCLNKKNEIWYTILVKNPNVTIHPLILNYVKQKKNNNSNYLKTDNNNIDNNKLDKYINNKKKINNLSLDLPLTNKNNNNSNNKIGKFIILFNIFYL